MRVTRCSLLVACCLLLAAGWLAVNIAALCRVMLFVAVCSCLLLLIGECCCCLLLLFGVACGLVVVGFCRWFGLGFVCWLLVVACTLLVVGWLLLVVGCWLLVVSC